MSFNSETFSIMSKFAIAMMGILLLIFLIAVVTPRLAKLIDKRFGNAKIDRGADSVPNPARVEDNKAAEYKVYDIYDGTPSDDKDNFDKKD